MEHRPTIYPTNSLDVMDRYWREGRHNAQRLAPFTPETCAVFRIADASGYDTRSIVVRTSAEFRAVKARLDREGYIEGQGSYTYEIA
jgi:hypothetical protein